MKQLEKYKLQVVPLSETGIYESRIKLVGDYTMVYSGLPRSNEAKTKSAHNVIICLDKNATNVWKSSGAEWKAVNERIIRIRLQCATINVSYITVNAPVNPQNKEMVGKCDQFYVQLQETVDKIWKGGMIIIMGDFNARVGKEDHLVVSQVLGPESHVDGRLTLSSTKHFVDTTFRRQNCSSFSLLNCLEQLAALFQIFYNSLFFLVIIIVRSNHYSHPQILNNIKSQILINSW